MSPWGGSIFRTRAPLSASQVVAKGPASAWERSRTRRSSSAIGMVRSGPFRMRSLFADPLAEALACRLDVRLARRRIDESVARPLPLPVVPVPQARGVRMRAHEDVAGHLGEQ